MFAVALAAMSALSYGASDFSGALASKDNDATVVTVFVQIVSLAALLVIVGLFPGDEQTATDFAWGALGGLGAALGLATFYKALALGPMSTAAALTALVSAAVPVIAGLALGDRPGVITGVGILLAVPAAVMVSVGGIGLHAVSVNAGPRERFASRQHEGRTRVLSVLAGLGFGLFFIALSRTSPDAGLFPLLGARVASISALSLVLTVGGLWAPIRRAFWSLIGIAGLLDCAANSFYLLALRDGDFIWVAAISSLYPVSTVLLARIVLKERLTPVQIAGLAMAGVALALVAVGADL